MRGRVSFTVLPSHTVTPTSGIQRCGAVQSSSDCQTDHSFYFSIALEILLAFH